MAPTYNFARISGKVSCRMPNGETIDLPVIQGILKHPDKNSLAKLLKKPEVAIKYTREALRVAAWDIISAFPKKWLLTLIDQTDIRPSRKRALLFMLHAEK